MSKGRFTLDRKIFDWEWWGDDNTTITFLTLIGNANYKDNNFRGKLIKRGQFVCSLESLARDARRSVRQIRTAIEKLKKTGEIVVEATNRGSVITVVNYDKYQDFGTVSQDDRHANRQANDTPNDKLTTRQPTTTNKGNKENKVITSNNIGDVNSFDYFGEDADLRSSERELRNRTLWTELNTLWSTAEYPAVIEKLYKSYWVKMSEQDQELLLVYLRDCKDINLNKVWKGPLFKTGSVNPEKIQTQLDSSKTPEQLTNERLSRYKAPITRIRFD